MLLPYKRSKKMEHFGYKDWCRELYQDVERKKEELT